MTSPATLTEQEKRIIKALLASGVRNQDIQALINYERPATINAGRITAVKTNDKIAPASNDEVTFYKRRKRSFDPTTDLNPYDDERLIRAREAMILAVNLFNSAGYRFKTEVFAVLANIAWTYIMLEYYERNSIRPYNKDGTAFALSHMLSRADCPLPKGIKHNLSSLKTIRDEVEHKMLGRSDLTFLPIFQACCLNFERTLVLNFGERLSLGFDISVALQFSKLDFYQAAILNEYKIPSNIAALDARLRGGLSEDELNDVEYQFRVVYTLDSTSKGKAHIQFINPDTAEGVEVHNVLQKWRIADELYSYKPSEVVKEVTKRLGKTFTMNDHTLSWQKHKIRPANSAPKPEKTDRLYCIYHRAYNGYTYNEKWIDRLVSEFGGGVAEKQP